MSFYTAQVVRSTNVVAAVSETSGPLKSTADILMVNLPNLSGAHAGDIYNPDTGTFTTPEAEANLMAAMKQHFRDAGYDEFGFAELKDVEDRLHAAGKTSPHLVAVRNWKDAQLAKLLAEDSDFEPAPHSWTETYMAAVTELST